MQRMVLEAPLAGEFLHTTPVPTPRPIDVGRVALGVDPGTDTDTFRALALFAQEGHAQAMEQALTEVAWGWRTATLTLQHGTRGEAPLSYIETKALRLALKIHQLGLPARIQPTEEAQAVLKRDRKYLELQHLVHVDLAAKAQRARNLQFHVIGRLARLAAGPVQ